ncbi:MAG: hypothetical protein NUW37_07595 [Planctomycetes bacterium]|nr:hypothetical protein [Planctomycetota bacterium]
MAKTWLEKDLDKSFEKGRREGKKEFLLSSVKYKFGEAAGEVADEIMEISDLDALGRVTELLLEAKNFREFKKLLAKMYACIRGRRIRISPASRAAPRRPRRLPGRVPRVR